MKTRSGLKRSGWIWMGLLLAVLLPVTALGQWTIAGTATVEDELGVGTQNPSRGIHLVGPNAVFRMDRDRYSSAFMLVRTAAGDFNTIWKSFSIGVSASGVNDGVFTISDKDTTAGGTGPARFTIDNDGQVEIGAESDPQAGLHVRNPTTGSLLRLDSNDGTQVVTVQNDGDIYARGEDLELRLTQTTSGGFDLGEESTVLANTGQGDSEEAFLALNGVTATICSPGDNNQGMLQIMDQDGYMIYYRLRFGRMELGYGGDYAIMATNHHTGDELILSTTGEQVQFVADSDNNTGNSVNFTWYNNGTANGDRVMNLEADGDLNIAGALDPNHAFDLAEAYWKSEAGIEAGDVVCFDPDQPNAVTLARSAGDRTVVGVVSTDPCIVMGGGAFSAEKLAERWGKDIAARFAQDREQIQADLVGNDDYLQGRIAKVAQLNSARAKGGKQAREDAENLAHEQQQLEDAIEGAALDAFCKKNLAQVALAGRVPVKVDASYGAIQAGDLLVASATPGRAMRADNPGMGTVIGKAMESYAAGRGTIMMMVLNR